jgi:hypothetical protein
MKELSHQSTRREMGNRVEITEESHCCVRLSKFMRGY